MLGQVDNVDILVNNVGVIGLLVLINRVLKEL